jgi:hypothetical protein
MNSEHRLTATRYIWVSFFFAMIIVNANVVMNGDALTAINVVMTTVIALAATGTTVSIWATANGSSEESDDTKLKRGERVTRLIDLMDDDELYELRKRLSKEVDMPHDDYVTLEDDGELRHRQLKN